jgi:cell division protein FtsL
MNAFLHKLAAVLLLAVIGVAIAVVHMSHRARKLTSEIAQEQTRSHKLETQFRQMQLERAQWSAAARVSQKAKEELRMQLPDASQTVPLFSARVGATK